MTVLHDFTGRKSYTSDMQREWLGDTCGVLSGAALEIGRAIRIQPTLDPELVRSRIDSLYEMVTELRDVARQRAEGARRRASRALNSVTSSGRYRKTRVRPTVRR